MKKRIAAAILAAALLAPSAVVSAEEVNPAPTVIPAVREWEGATGRFVPGNGMKLVVTEGTSVSQAKIDIIAGYFDDMFGIALEVSDGAPSAGDLVLVTGGDESVLGKDGYILEVGDTVTVTAPNDIGLLYGVITVVQSVSADGYVPCGTARDYSYYKCRGGMLDVARAYLSLEYVEEITKYFAYFKLNEIHLHINDNGENGYTAFRLESDVPGLTSTDGYYTKDAYRAYQKRMAEYGVTVITEIDTPAHSSCFASCVASEYMVYGYHIDISNPDAVQFVLDLFDEYITGDDPVFVSDTVHIGTDEYPAGHEEEMRAYTDTLLRHISSRGYTPRFWGSFGGTGFNGNTPVTSDAQTNFWAVELSDYKTLLDMGYDVINTCGPVLYIVPGGNYGFADYYDLSSLYTAWYVNYLGWNESTSVSPDNPQLLGGSFALWNDLYTEYSGFSVFDIFDRVRGGVCLMAEKTWCGEQTREIGAADFVARYDLLSQYSGDSDPGRHKIDDIDGEVPSGVTSFGWPYTASAEVTVNKLGDGFTLFGGKDGEFRVLADGTPVLCRGGYEFSFDCKIEEGRTTTVGLIADNRQTLLVIDGTYYYFPINNLNSQLTRSSTFVLPLERIGDGLDGSVSGLKVVSGAADLNKLVVNANLALGAKVTVSGLEVNDGRFTADLAVDGDESTRLSFSAAADYQWMVVDLGEIKPVNCVEIMFFEHISDYTVSVSTDGENYTEAAHITIGDDGKKQTDRVDFDMTEARYIKYEQHKRFCVTDWNAYYSGGILEFRVYGFDEAKYRSLIDRAEECISAGAPDTLRAAKNALKNYLSADTVFATHLEGLSETLSAEIDSFLDSQSAVSEAESSAAEPSAFNPAWYAAAAAVAVAAIGAAVYIILNKRRKK